MKRIIVAILFVIPSFVFAQQLSSNIEFGVGGGYSSLGYKAGKNNFNPSTIGGFSPTIHLGYAFYFCDWVGLGVGVDWTMYGGGVKMSGKQVWNGVTDTDGELYNHHLVVDNWTERHTLHYLEIPLSLRFQAPGNGIRMIGEIGAKWGLPIGANYAGSGSLTHYGYYEPWDLTLRDEPNHGFYTESGYHPSGRMDAINQKWSIFGKLGVAIPVTNALNITIQAYGQYSVSSIGKVGGTSEIGFAKDRTGMDKVHYFMPSYSSLLNTTAVTGEMRPWNIGLELGLRYVFIHKTKKCYPCKVWID